MIGAAHSVRVAAMNGGLFMIEINNDPKVPAYRRIVNAVSEAVAAGRLMPGQKLPARLTLARELGVNPTTVRHAYEILERQGVLVGKHGSGTFVQPNARQRLEQGDPCRFRTICVVLGAAHPADCHRDTHYIVSDILAGVDEELGSASGQGCRFVFAEALTRAFLEQMPLDEGCAVLLHKPGGSDPKVVESLVREGVPMVGVWADTGSLGVPYVQYDPHQAAALACQHLVDCGYRRIGFVGKKRGGVRLGVKFFEFTNTLHAAGLDCLARHVADVPDPPSGAAYRAVQQMVQSGDSPDALFVDTDLKAIEAVRALKDAGLEVPRDIGVVGYDDIPEAATLDPPLTTVRTPRREIGRRAAQLLKTWPAAMSQPHEVTLGSALIVRGSTRAARPHDASAGADGAAVPSAAD